MTVRGGCRRDQIRPHFRDPVDLGRGDVRLRWVDGTPKPTGDRSCHVFVMPRGRPPEDEDSPWMVGELVVGMDSRAVAIASITGARRIVDEQRASGSRAARDVRPAHRRRPRAGGGPRDRSLPAADEHSRGRRADACPNPDRGTRPTATDRLPSRQGAAAHLAAIEPAARLPPPMQIGLLLPSPDRPSSRDPNRAGLHDVQHHSASRQTTVPGRIVPSFGTTMMPLRM